MAGNRCWSTKILSAQTVFLCDDDHFVSTDIDDLIHINAPIRSEMHISRSGEKYHLQLARDDLLIKYYSGSYGKNTCDDDGDKDGKYQASLR